MRLAIARILVFTLVASLVSSALPASERHTAFGPASALAAGETVASPRFATAAVMPNGNVGLVFLNVNGTSSEIRFKRYKNERATDSSLQLSTAAGWYPQLVNFRGELVAAYVDTRSPNAGKLAMRISTDNGATWGSESYPLGSATFDSANFAPRVVTARDGQTLYVFSATGGAIPQYRSSTDTTLVTWSAAAAAGDSSMRVATGNNCGNAGQECYRAHAFFFVETAQAGRWLYISKSDSGYGQSGRGTQYGSLGGSWSTQVDLLGSGGASGGGESSASAFVARDSSLYYLRALGSGENIYYQRSTDNGASWGGRVYLFSKDQPLYTAGSPVGVSASSYSQSDYVWFAGFGGTEDTVRVSGIWPAPAAYGDTGTTRLFGSAGGDWDEGFEFADAFGSSLAASAISHGVFTTAATDLSIAGRLLPFSFTRSYNSADLTPGPLGRGWTHSFNWKLSERASGDVEIRRGDGRRDLYVKQTGGAYTPPLGVFDTLVRNTSGSYTLTTRDQVSYELIGPAQDNTAYAAAVGADSPASYWRLSESTGTSAADSGSAGNTGTYSGGYALAMEGALHDSNHAVALNGTTGKVTAGTTSMPIGSAARTIEAWVFPQASGGTILAENTSSGQKFMLLDAQISGSWYLFTDGVNANNNITLSGSEIPVVGAWSHIALVFDGSAGTWKYYLNGAPTKNGTFGTAINTAALSSTWIGDRADASTPFSGSLDEVAVYASALSATRIAAHYQAGLYRGGLLTQIHEPAGNHIDLAYSGTDLTTITDTVGRAITLTYDSRHHLTALADPSGRSVGYLYDSQGRLSGVTDALPIAAGRYAAGALADSPAAYWRLGESSGTSATDAGPNGNTGTYTGGYTLGATGALVRDTNTAVTLNGSSGKVTAGTTSLPTGSAARTIEAWVKPSGNGGVIFAENSSSGQKFILLDLNAGGTWYLFTDGVNNGNNITLEGAEIPATGVWSHIAFVFDGTAGTWHYYLNGAPTRSGTFGTTINTATLSSSWIGDRADVSQPFNGSIDEVAVYPSALSAAKVAAHYRLGLAPSWLYDYDGATPRLAAITDPDLRAAVTNTYDSSGRLASQADGRGKTTVFTYGSSTVTTTDPRLHDTVVTFDSHNRPITVSDVVGQSTYTLQYTYDDCGNRSSVTDRSGHRTDYTFDTGCKGNLVSLDEPQLDAQTPRFETTWTYDSKNNPTLRTDAKGFTTSWTYDGTSNVRLSETRQIDVSTSATTKWLYGDSNNPGLPTRVVAPRGNTTGTPDNTYSTVLAYDSSGNLTSSTDADGDITTFGYDSLGRRTSMVDADGNVSGGTPSQHTWTTAYDAIDRITSQTDPLSHATSSTYDYTGHRLTATDKDGNVTTYTYDGTGLLATVAQKPDPSGSPSTVYTTTVTRDDNGNAIRVTQGNGVQTDYSYDALNRLTSTTTHPASGTDLVTDLVTGLVLDANGNVTTRTTADNVSTTYTYDNLDRLTQISATGLSTISYAYDELHRRTQMTDGVGTTTYSYDRMGRLTQAAQPNGTVSYGYDLDSDRTTLTYPGSSSVTYSFSNAGRLSSLTDWGSRTTSYTYTAAGLAATVTLPNNMVTTYTYDRAQRLTNLTNVISGTTITSHAYTLDSEGNRTALSEFVSGITSGASDSFGFTYDGLERLTGVTTTNAETFTLDGASNITARTGPSKTFTIDSSNRPTSDGTNTLTWSSADRMTGRGSDSFGYDPLDRLTSSTVSSTSRTYAYNGDGLLQSRTTGGSTVNLLWDPATSPSRLLASGSDKIVYGLGPLYSVNGSTVTTYARDGQKSVRAELNGSTVNGSWRYRAYGEIAQSNGASTPSLLGYAGQLLDPSGLYYMRARWYDAGSARLLSRDPEQTGPAVTEPRNAFGYSGANPLNRADPSGLDPILDPDDVAPGLTSVPWWRQLLNWAERFLGNESAAQSSSVRRILSSNELGENASLSRFTATLDVTEGRATIQIDMIEGEVQSPFGVITRLKDIARSEGAATLRIQGSIGNEELYNVLQARYGARLVTEGGVDYIDFALPK